MHQIIYHNSTERVASGTNRLGTDGERRDMRSAEQLFAELGNKEVKRPNNTTEDRKFRDYIEDANRNGDFIIQQGNEDIDE